jgi:hypothetical protein
LALWINQGTQWFSSEPPETPRTRCSLRQSPLMTRLPRSPGSTLVLRLNQETIHDFILLFLPPCGLHLTPLATGSLDESYLSSHRQRHFALVLHLHQHQSRRNLHLQYLAKNQFTQRCQSLITPGSDHPPVLEPHMVLDNPSGERMATISLNPSSFGFPIFPSYFPWDFHRTSLRASWRDLVRGKDDRAAS